MDRAPNKSVSWASAWYVNGCCLVAFSFRISAAFLIHCADLHSTNFCASEVSGCCDSSARRQAVCVWISLYAFPSQLAVLALRSLANLHVLDVSHTVITGDSLPRLCLALPRLKALSLAYNRLTEASLPTLNTLQELEYLDIREIGPISFTCIRNACKSPSLQRIRVSCVIPVGVFSCRSTSRFHVFGCRLTAGTLFACGLLRSFSLPSITLPC